MRIRRTSLVAAGIVTVCVAATTQGVASAAPPQNKLTLKTLCRSDVPTATGKTAKLTVKADITQGDNDPYPTIAGKEKLVFPAAYAKGLRAAGHEFVSVRVRIYGDALTGSAAAGFFLNVDDPKVKIPKNGKLTLAGPVKSGSMLFIRGNGDGKVVINDVTVNMTPVDKKGVPTGEGAFNTVCSPNPPTQDNVLGPF
ncbi:hypothetical protein [Actinomadura atramentaria]|uniref:hypothetical protein n=1 Tax=Actinomadura atramentaria TaxID=1990 RepID=UPI00036804AD|nr:hypothetical protein [Actinomadura atramentaria]